MALVIGAGVMLTATPFVLEYLVPASKTSFQAADDQEAQQAIKRWFNAEVGEVTAAKAIRQVSAQSKLGWFEFHAEREAVVRFIRQQRLQQKELSEDELQRIFKQVDPPVAWWQPERLERKSYFVGGSQQEQLYLIYNDALKLGFLMTKSQQKKQGF